MTSMKKLPTIGIDLGTTYSCVAVYQLGKVEVIANDLGKRTTPSYVAFKKGERVVGLAAKNYKGANDANTIHDVKRLIGRKFNENEVQSDIKKWSFEVINVSEEPKIQITDDGKLQEFSTQEISAMVLRKMKQIAKTYLGTKEELLDAVITVPAYFNNSQREATIEAGTIAGFNVRKILNEPTAAAIAYGSDKKIKQEQNILIFDLGGGTFDVSIVNISNSVFSVIAKGGNTHLGGGDFDNRMVSHFVTEILQTFNTDISNNKRALRRLRLDCEEAKTFLTSNFEASIDIDYLFDGNDFRSTITRATFDDLNYDLFKLTIEIVENTLNDAKMKKSDINEIVLIGGSTRILKIQEMLQKFFDGKELNMSINPDEAVAYGAAIEAAMLDNCYELQNMILSDVTPLSLGVDIKGDIMSVVIQRNTPIPVKRTKNYCTIMDNQTSITFDVYEGERSVASLNHHLARFEVGGIKRLPRGKAAISETFEIDVNGVLTVTAVEQTSGNTKKLIVSKNKSQLRKEVVDSMIQEAEEFRIKDERRVKTVKAKNELEYLCYDVRSALQNEISIMSFPNKKFVINRCTEILTAIKTLTNDEEIYYNNTKKEVNGYIEKYKINIENR